MPGTVNPFYRWRIWSLKKWKDLDNALQLRSGGARSITLLFGSNTELFLSTKFCFIKVTGGFCSCRKVFHLRYLINRMEDTSPRIWGLGEASLGYFLGEVEVGSSHIGMCFYDFAHLCGGWPIWAPLRTVLWGNLLYVITALQILLLEHRVQTIPAMLSGSRAILQRQARCFVFANQLFLNLRGQNLLFQGFLCF